MFALGRIPKLPALGGRVRYRRDLAVWSCLRQGPLSIPGALWPTPPSAWFWPSAITTRRS